MANQPVRLGQIHLSATGADRGGVKEQRGVTDARGMVRWTDLPTGQDNGYVAVTEHEGLRLSVEPFRMPDDSGMRGQILALRRTRDPSVLQLDPRTKVIVDLREEALAVMIGLFFRNVSQEIFDPGPDGLLIPMPEGAVNAQEIEGGEPLEIVPGKGIRIRSVIPPDSAASFISTARYGYILPTDGASTMELSQPMPIALPDPFILVPDKDGTGAGGPGAEAPARRRRRDRRQGQACSARRRSPPAGPWSSPSPTSPPAIAPAGPWPLVLCVAAARRRAVGFGFRRGKKAAAGGTSREDADRPAREAVRRAGRASSASASAGDAGPASAIAASS